jgi:hypothetical protein
MKFSYFANGTFYCMITMTIVVALDLIDGFGFKEKIFVLEMRTNCAHLHIDSEESIILLRGRD